MTDFLWHTNAGSDVEKFLAGSIAAIYMWLELLMTSALVILPQMMKMDIFQNQQLLVTVFWGAVSSNNLEVQVCSELWQNPALLPDHVSVLKDKLIAILFH